MRKFTMFALLGLILSRIAFTEEASAVTTGEIEILVAGYSVNYFANANSGIKNSLIKSLESISSNIEMYDTETDPVFKSELKEEIRKGIEALILKTNGCTEGDNSLASDDWLIDCQAQNEIYIKLKELLVSY